MRAISLAEANKIINGTFAFRQAAQGSCIGGDRADAGGRVKAFQKQDGASLMRFEIAYGRRSGRLRSTALAPGAGEGEGEAGLHGVLTEPRRRARF
jgi:uncharacterized protein GlcG (DUF336 family)